LAKRITVSYLSPDMVQIHSNLITKRIKIFFKLFHIYILLRNLEGGGCKAVAYADDVAIIFNGKYPQTLCDLMTAKLKILSELTLENGLGVNPSKTELVLFTNR